MERFFLNVELVRVLYAHALVANSRLALGRWAPIGPAAGDPRLSMTGIFVSLGRVLPDTYPLNGDVAPFVAMEHNVGRTLDYGLIEPRLPELYAWSAGALGLPGFLECIDGHSPTYAWSASDHDVSHPGRPHAAVRAMHRLAPKNHSPGLRRWR